MKKVAIVLILSILGSLSIVSAGLMTERNPVSACNPDELPIYLIGPAYSHATPSAPSNECNDVNERDPFKFSLLRAVVKSTVVLFNPTQEAY